MKLHYHNCRMPPRIQMGVIEEKVGHCTSTISCYGTTKDECRHTQERMEIACLMQEELTKLGVRTDIIYDKWVKYTENKLDDAWTAIRQ